MILVKPSYEILTEIDAERILASLERAGRTCYKSEDRITETSAPVFCKMLLGRNHESVVEHESLTVRFVIDRGVSHELVRHRLCAFSQESTRYCDYGKKGVVFVIPPWVDLEPGEYTDYAFCERWPAGTVAWLEAMWHAEFQYKGLVGEGCGWTPQQARSVLPNSLKTEIVTTANLRQWRHIMSLRTSPAAHPQMREVMVPLLAELKARIPVIFDDIGRE